MSRETRIVDDRVFLLGLDRLYRRTMMWHESDELLQCARAVAQELGVPPSQGPVEGYYAESGTLTEYFLLMRGLQKVEASHRPRVRGLPEFRRLEDVTSSPLFGKAVDPGYLLPAGRDPLSHALQEAPPDAWAIDPLLERAHRVAIDEDDYSLVGLAARVRDPVILTATRETVVLYTEMVFGIAFQPSPPKYVWAVDRELARQGVRFVETFNSLFDEELPAPGPENAEEYWHASDDNKVVGRCVRLGVDESQIPIRHYHWAIAPSDDGRGEVEEFWDQELWTTARYQQKLRT